MSEPAAVAHEATEVLPGIWHWLVADDRIGGQPSAAHAVAGPGGTVLIDPLRLDGSELEKVGEVTAIVLTTGNHARSAWRLRDALGASVHVPALSESLRDRADATYGEGDTLPGGLRALFTPGAGTTQHTLFAGERAAFVPDLLMRPEGQELSLVPDEYMADPGEARQSLRRLLAEPFDALFLAHGTPVTEDPKGAIRRVLGEAAPPG